MQSVYSQYKNLKRTVRDEAATDIQRVFRGMMVRVETGALLSSTVTARRRAPSPAGGDHSYSSSPRRLQGTPGKPGSISSFSPTRHSRPRDYDDDTVERHQSARIDDDVRSHIAASDTAQDDTSFEIKSPSKRKTLNKISSSTQDGTPQSGTSILHSPTVRGTFGSSDTFDLGSGSHDSQAVGAEAQSAQHQQRKRKGADVRSPSTSSVVEWLQTPAALTLKSNYRELLAQKNSLKSLLKRFDDDFKAKHGRLPVRKEKEVCA